MSQDVQAPEVEDVVDDSVVDHQPDDSGKQQPQTKTTVEYADVDDEPVSDELVKPVTQKEEDKSDDKSERQPLKSDEKRVPDESGKSEVEFPDYLLRAAGITSEQAKKQFGNPETLEAAVRMLDQRFVALGQAHLYSQQPKTDDRTGGQQKQPVSTEFQLPKPAEGEDWDEDTKKLVVALNDHYQKIFKAQSESLLEQQQAVAQLLQDRGRWEQHQYLKEFDDFVNKLGEEWEGILGRGEGPTLPADSIAMQNRIHLDSIANQLAIGRRVQGQQALPRQELLKRALQVAFPQHQEQTMKKQVVDQVTKRGNLKTARPTARRSSQLSGEESAVKKAEKWYSDHGFSVTEDNFDYTTI